MDCFSNSFFLIFSKYILRKVFEKQNFEMKETYSGLRSIQKNMNKCFCVRRNGFAAIYQQILIYSIFFIIKSIPVSIVVPFIFGFSWFSKCFFKSSYESIRRKNIDRKSRFNRLLPTSLRHQFFQRKEMLFTYSHFQRFAKRCSTKTPRNKQFKTYNDFVDFFVSNRYDSWTVKE